MENSLNLAKSNLQLLMANNEMLEEALRRDSQDRYKDVGWQRRSGRDLAQKQAQVRMSTESEPSSHNAMLGPVTNSTPPPASPVPSAHSPGSGNPDTSFFGIRFSTSSLQSRWNSYSAIQNRAISSDVRHSSPASISSPISSLNVAELEELRLELEAERKARKVVMGEKAALEAEIESLSQALFEEVRSCHLFDVTGRVKSGLQANKMVASERIGRAETEAELKEVQLEKEALHRALALLESENSELRKMKMPHSADPAQFLQEMESSLPVVSSQDADKSVLKDRVMPLSSLLSLGLQLQANSLSPPQEVEPSRPQSTLFSHNMQGRPVYLEESQYGDGSPSRPVPVSLESLVA
jgi:hypothetical protein